MRIAVLAIVVLTATSVLFYMAAAMVGFGNPLASQICYSADTLCRYPSWPLAAAVILLGIVATLRYRQARRG
jgi:hypothetical protein